ncbi:eCIS core domain-containing protein [Solitalea canadensis]|uniref:eCIS core domain-containing protein n=1 Tax=Solitalea canadensis (strain ATCC 29591 / DSM 3403 / JCM 21819 / LMG 8368 / NBRC 15130 / NCIMB 12057 / USAM 9D) TaxID=929556 RepID=H8KU82_SOLCM|nr:DUF4157 domain-containing protein [Solitalea canadensis]AFD07194.1 hypothetical protein Solca_2141 [Solitalea canadensis DSM 3403]
MLSFSYKSTSSEAVTNPNSSHFFAPFIQPKLTVNQPNDSYEQQADAVADQIIRTADVNHSFFRSKDTETSSIQRKCSHCEEEEKLQLKPGSINNPNVNVPASVYQTVNTSGQSLDMGTRSFMESRFGADFNHVRIHTDENAHQSSSAINARAYTHRNHIVFGDGQYQPNTLEGKRLLAHELAHVMQQSTTSNHIQRQKKTPVQSDIENLVKKGKWCRDSAESGKLHPGLQCYREIPAAKGHPPGDQYCFDKDTGAFKESSPDFVSAVSGQLKDGTCDIPMKLTDPPQPFTQRGQRSMGHLIGDIATEDANLIGGSFGAFTGITMGIGLPKGGFGANSLWVPAVLGAFGLYLGSKGLPRFNKFAERRGFLPTISLGGGTNFDLKLGIGLEKRDRPLPIIPINSYLTFGVDTSLGITDEPGINASFLATVGIRVDPKKQGGGFGFGSVGGGFQVGKDASTVGSYNLGLGYRFTDFLDVQVERESITGGEESGSTYWLKLKLVAPQNVLKGH